MELTGRRARPGTKVTAPSSTPKAMEPSEAASTASGAGQPSVTWKVYISSAPNTQNAPCDKFTTPVTR